LKNLSIIDFTLIKFTLELLMKESHDLDKARQAIAWIISTRPDLVQKAKEIAEGKLQQSSEKDNSPLWKKAIRKIKEICVVDPKDLHGHVYVTKGLQKNSKITANTITLSNVLDAGFNFPLFYFCFQGMNPVIAFIIALTSTGFVFASGNELGAAVARNKPSNRSWSIWACLGLISLNVLQTGATGVGIELINNRAELEEIYSSKIANQYLEKKQRKIADLSTIKDPIYQTVQQKCQEGEAKLNSLSRSNPLWNTYYVRLYGLFDERSSNWEKIPYQQLPVCRQVTRLEDENNLKYQKAFNEYQFLLTARTDGGSDLQFLKNHAQSAFEQHFNSEGQMKSGPILVGLATTQVYTKLFNGKWSELGLSLFILAISAITSLAACTMAISHALNKDIKLSYDEDLQKEIDYYFQSLRLALMEAQKQDTSFFPNSDTDLETTKTILEETLENETSETDSFGKPYSVKSLPTYDEEYGID